MSRRSWQVPLPGSDDATHDASLGRPFVFYKALGKWYTWEDEDGTTGRQWQWSTNRTVLGRWQVSWSDSSHDWYWVAARPVQFAHQAMDGHCNSWRRAKRRALAELRRMARNPKRGSREWHREHLEHPSSRTRNTANVCNA